MAIPFNSDGFCPIEYDPPIRPHPWHDWWTPVVEQLKQSPVVDFQIELEMAGTKKSSISVKVKGDYVVARWTTRFGQLQNRSLFVGAKYYDLTKTDVKFEDGLLTIRCPLIPPPPPPPEDPEIPIEIK